MGCAVARLNVSGIYYLIGFQIVSIVGDAHGEGCDAYHPVDKMGTYDSQKEQAKPYVEKFLEKRLPRYCMN